MGLTLPRLKQEWESLSAVFREDILERLTICHLFDDGIVGFPNPPPTRMVEFIIKTVERERGHVTSQRPIRSAEAIFDILRVLLIHWIRRSGPLKANDFGRETGFSYPTLAAALNELEPHLKRHSDRRFELRSFPRDAWFRLVAKTDKVRHRQAYVDRSGRPRPIEALLGRLRELKREDIAVGGVLGARHYLPGLDLIGTPRLDLVLHSPGKGASTEFLRKLDPALKPAERGELPQVVVHTLFRPLSYFTPGDGLPWADEVECLLDLHDMRLEQQALEFLDHLQSKAMP
ncbi:MAG: hypothetical protein IPK22_17220 [Verrucomicrobiaceae bacterium]|nr:hypothetical protein [Verrucomicrobiaceae bacterium]